MRNEYQRKMTDVVDKIKFYTGDVREFSTVKSTMHDVDCIFHAATLKQVTFCEFFPIEAVKTNFIGTDNALTAAIEEEVKSVICLSTDKAAYPDNAIRYYKSIIGESSCCKIKEHTFNKNMLHTLWKCNVY